MSPDRTEDSVVSLENVTVHFNENRGIVSRFLSSAETVHAVDDVSIDVPPNDVIALVGESGCGKTTLGKTLIGVQRPTEGSVTYRGQDIWDAKDRRGDISISFQEIRQSLQIVHQDPGSALNPNRKVRKILESPLKKCHSEMNYSDRHDRVIEMLETVGMTPPEDYAFRYPHQLSGGEMQRVALIRALLMNPDVILADEAVSALDVSLRVEMMDLMLDLQNEFRTSYLFVSHNLSNARYLAGRSGGRIGVMYLGKLVEIGPVEQVIQNPQHPYTKALKWSTPNLESTNQEKQEPPLRSIEVPDATNPPSGCRFHTRCPEAREVCREEEPQIVTTRQNGKPQHASCFRIYDDHEEYWTSDSIK